VPYILRFPGFRIRAVHTISFFMKEDESPDPAHVGFFGADGVMLGPGLVANLVEQLWRLRVGYIVLLEA
jgi:hypothetical protein